MHKIQNSTRQNNEDKDNFPVKKNNNNNGRWVTKQTKNISIMCDIIKINKNTVTIKRAGSIGRWMSPIAITVFTNPMVLLPTKPVV